MKSVGERLAEYAVAGNGLLHRRALLGRGLAVVGALGTGAVSTGVGAEPLTEPDWSLILGEPMPAYQVPSPFEKNVVRFIDNPNGLPVISHARTPHQLLSGIITPNGLHFNVNHGGVPAIDPARQPLAPELGWGQCSKPFHTGHAKRGGVIRPFRSVAAPREPA